VRPLSVAKRGINKVLKFAGVELARVPDTSRFHVDAFRDQRRLIRSAGSIFDVGAHVGQTTLTYRSLFPEAQIYCFEPGPVTFDELKAKCNGLPRVTPINCAVGDRVGEAAYYMNMFSATNSLLPVSAAAKEYTNPAWLASAGTVTATVTTIDQFCKDHGIEHISILKMDIQGGELMALRGAEETLTGGRADLVYSEVLFASLYEKQATFFEIHAHLEARGYTLFGLYDMQYGVNPKGELAWCDALYCRNAMLDAHKREAPV
jgi:FkbM family methyltransferase